MATGWQSPQYHDLERRNDYDNDEYQPTTTDAGLRWRESKHCPLCNEMVEDLVEHYERCDSSGASGGEHAHRNTNDSRPVASESSGASSIPLRKRTKDCIMCFKPVLEDDYVQHVQQCVAEATGESNERSGNGTVAEVCFSCGSAVNCDDGTGVMMSCEARHMYCIRCLRKSMNNFVRNQSEPVCHQEFCPYALSQQDLFGLPLEHNLRHNLLKLVKTQRRPLCDRCFFYINLTNTWDFDEHLRTCKLDEAIPCEYCLCPQEITQWEEHSRQCRSDLTNRRRKLVDFIVTRTKYPFTPQQIDFFIEKRKNDGLPIDPRSIVAALAVFDDVFPVEIPTRDCDICMETFSFDDFFVVGCSDDHKMCYHCYENSCRTQMRDNQVLTCPMCSYQLQYGDLKQLRVSPDERELIVEYQTQKTLDCFARGNRAMIKCPREFCMWMVETQDPTSRFRVECPMCYNEFCSLCNQQYHYRTPCSQVPQLTQRWFLWCNSERGRYLANRARQDAAYAAKLADYERQKAAEQQRNADLRRRYDASVTDEQYKAEKCRLCPHCRRVIEHTGGCSSMICGQDYHGGNNQSGCGQSFTWDQAQPYVLVPVQKPEQLSRELPRPEDPIPVHENIRCDNCHEEVRGIRFDCIHCPSLIYCEKCEQKCTLDHSNANQFEGKQQHVFRLITTPDIQSSYF